MKICYFDCTSGGVSGDMMLGAAVDLGVPVETLLATLRRLPVGGYELSAAEVRRSGIRAVKATVTLAAVEHHHRGLREILAILDAAGLPPRVRERAARAFRLLVAAEARVHGVAEEEVHLHEVGAVDAIVDVVGTMTAFETLGIEAFHSSALRLGSGRIRSAHGELPVPAPAVTEILKGAPVFGGDHEGEFTTPTGAAIVASLVDGFGPLPPMAIERTGFGAGGRDPKGLPNVLRLVMGEAGGLAAGETVEVLEATIDDMNPQIFGHLFDRLFREGALEVFLAPVQMKKNRPGSLLTVLGRPGEGERLREVIFAETTTIGIRARLENRDVLDRRHVTVETPFGALRIKEALRHGRVVNAAPEYEDCRAVAEKQGVALKTVLAAATAAYRVTESRDPDMSTKNGQNSAFCAGKMRHDS